MLPSKNNVKIQIIDSILSVEQHDDKLSRILNFNTTETGLSKLSSLQ